MQCFHVVVFYRTLQALCFRIFIFSNIVFVIARAHGSQQCPTGLFQLLITSNFANFLLYFLILGFDAFINFLQLPPVGLFLIISMQLRYTSVIVELFLESVGLPIADLLYFSQMPEVHFFPHLAADQVVSVQTEGHNIFNISLHIFIAHTIICWAIAPTWSFRDK